MRRSFTLLACIGGLLGGLSLVTPPAVAADNPPPIDTAAELQAAMDDVNSTLRRGPQDIDVAGQARLNLPNHYAFVPEPAAKRLLTAYGNRPGNDLVGMIVPVNGEDWLMTIRYVASGYIRDDDARDWQAEELLRDMRDGTESSNAERRRRNLPEIEVIGWVEAPQYDPATAQASAAAPASAATPASTTTRCCSAARDTSA